MFQSKYFPAKWREGGLMMDEEDAWMCVLTDDKGIISVKVLPETVGQYTGLKDSIGREIYEGDIVMSYVVFTDEEEITREFWRVGEICFVAGSFRLTNCTNYDDRDMKVKSDIQPSKKSTYSFPAYRSQILGNIHDNPELLKGGGYEKK